MTQMTQRTRNGQLLRLRFGEDRALDLSDLRDRLEDLEGLLLVAALAEEVERWPRVMPGWWRPTASAAAEDHVSQARTRASELARLRRVSYASPLEIVLYASAVTGAATSALGVAYSAVRLFERVQMAKVTRARADAQTLAYQVLAEDLDLRRSPEPLQAYTPAAALTGLDRKHRQDVARAISALAALQSADVVDERDD